VAAALLAVAVQAGSGTVAAQANCAVQKEPERIRCEREAQIAKACAGRTGDALAVCRNKMLEPQPERRDCARLPEGYGRYKCEDENLRMDIEARCGAKLGDEYSRCYAEVMAKALAR
jgi:hypothetical protein